MAQNIERKIRYNQHINIAINLIMVAVVAYYTYCARGQLEEARKSNELNQKVAYANFSSTQKSLDMTQESLRTTKESLDRMNENVKILKNTQNAKIVLDHIQVDKINFDKNVPVDAFVMIRNIGTVPATFGDNCYACASIAAKVPSKLECQNLAKQVDNKGHQNTLGPAVQGYGLRVRVPENISDSTKKQLKDGSLHLFVVGSIPYSDYLSKKTFSFCYKWAYTDESLRSMVPTIPMSFEANWTTCNDGK